MSDRSEQQQAVWGTTERNALMAERVRNGETLAAVGTDYGLTRERVRQIVARVGVTGADSRAARRVDFTCPMCGRTESLVASQANRNTCKSDECKRTASLNRRPAFNRGLRGHWVCRDPRTRTTMRAERYLAQQRLGRALARTEWVVLRDGDPDNLSDENIVVKSASEVCAGRDTAWTKESVSNAVATFVARTGRLPMFRDCGPCNGNGLPSYATIRRKADGLGFPDALHALLPEVQQEAA